jgi:hypothetical protein
MITYKEENRRLMIYIKERVVRVHVITISIFISLNALVYFTNLAFASKRVNVNDATTTSIAKQWYETMLSGLLL